MEPFSSFGTAYHGPTEGAIEHVVSSIVAAVYSEHELALEREYTFQQALDVARMNFDGLVSECAESDYDWGEMAQRWSKVAILAAFLTATNVAMAQHAQMEVRDGSADAAEDPGA